MASLLEAPIRRVRLHDQVVKQVALRIMRGDAAAADIDLRTEAALCNELNVSRTVLREAIKVLEAKGMVEVRPKKGLRVRPRSEWNVIDPDILAWQSELATDERFIRNLIEVRRIIEPAAAELAALRASEAEIAVMDEYFSLMTRTYDDTPAFISADMQFHDAIFAACHNDLLERFSSTIGNALRLSRVITTRRPGSSAASLKLHSAVADAIRRKDAPGARAAMEYLLSQTALDIEAVLHSETTADSEQS